MKKILSKCILAVFIFTMLVFCPNPVKAATPVEKNVNESFTDSLTERTSENWYRIVCGKNSYITLFFNPNNSSISSGWNISIYDESYTQIREYRSIEENFISDRFMFGNNATFYVKVTASNTYSEKSANVGVPYTISTKEVLDTSYEQESNNSFSRSTTLTSGKIKYGTIWKDDDVDFYSFKTTQTGYTQFEFGSESNKIVEEGWNISIFDSNGTLINEKKNVNGHFISHKLNVEKGTTLYVRIEAANGWYNPLDELYSIVAKETKTTEYETEPNNTVRKATKILKSKFGTILNGADKDYFKYKATKNKTMRLMFSIEDDDVSDGWNVEIYKKSVSYQNRLVYVEDITNDTTLKFKAKKGVMYYFIVTPNDCDYNVPTGITYKLTVK